MYRNSKVWQATLAPQNDQLDICRERLRQTFSGFRDRVGQLIQSIPSDILGLTVHDLTHLDALWDMADVLTGGACDLNPAEAFVFGGAILLHDSAMTVCAYKGGVDEIRQTAEYADAIAHIQSGLATTALGGSSELSPALEKVAISETLRVKHASKAEELALQQWESPVDGASIFLIDDSELRDHYGHSIGRIAHSHHWDISEISKRLGTKLGSFTRFPADWTIDQVKVALLLRCVDAMHIDDRRAPRFLASIRTIGPESMEHWRFQNKLGKPHLEDGRLVYTSKSPFHLEEATAWNLCFDTMQMIDRELRDTNDIHLQKGLSQFLAKGVAGSSSAEALAKYVEVEGWQPLPLSLKVSDVSKLAQTLGGKDLYNNPLAPLRELIQNSADAIEARSIIEEDFSIDDGFIAIRFIENEDAIILEIDDNGIGMSERVLTSALLDFGFSFWRSSDARTEFPGLQVEADRFRGRYGIGFFSIFMWSAEVLVSSRRFNEGVDESRVLEFLHGVESRPILRKADTTEKSSKFSTRIRLKLKPDFLGTAVPRRNRYGRTLIYEGDFFDEIEQPFSGQTWVQRVRLLCGALPVKVTLETNVGTEQVSLPNWRECSPQQFMDFFSGTIFARTESSERFIGNLAQLSQSPPLGGRCFVSPYSADGSRVAVYEKGIFVSFSRTPSIQGVVESSATNAARDRHSSLSIFVDEDWINQVRSKAFTAARNIGEKLAIQKIFLFLKNPDPNQPLFLQNRIVLSLNELKAKIVAEGEIYIRLKEESDHTFQWKATDKLAVVMGLSVDEKRVHTLVDFGGTVEPDSDFSKLVEQGDQPLFRMLREFRDLLGPSTTIVSHHIENNGYLANYIEVTVQAQTVGDTESSGSSETI